MAGWNGEAGCEMERGVIDLAEKARMHAENVSGYH